MKKILFLCGLLVVLAGCGQEVWEETNEQQTKEEMIKQAEQKEDDIEEKVKSEEKTVDEFKNNEEIENFSTTTEIPIDWKTYKNDKYGFEFKYPNHWQIKSVEGSGGLTGEETLFIYSEDDQNLIFDISVYKILEPSINSPKVWYEKYMESTDNFIAEGGEVKNLNKDENQVLFIKASKLPDYIDDTYLILKNGHIYSIAFREFENIEGRDHSSFLNNFNLVYTSFKFSE